jgi:hypothetical protein
MVRSSAFWMPAISAITNVSSRQMLREPGLKTLRGQAAH